jgi:hypothetical protein
LTFQFYLQVGHFSATWKSVLEGPVFEPLRDPAVFQQFQIHPEFHTLVWANGADIAPEFLHDNVRVTA